MNMQKKSLATISLFSGLTEEQRIELVQKCRWKMYQPDEYIIDRDHQDTDVYFIVNGEIRVVNYGAQGKEVSYADIPMGTCFGELSAIDGRARSATVIALAPSFIASMTASTFREVLHQYPVVAFALLQRLTAIARASSERVFELSTVAANYRVFGELLRLSKAKQATLPAEQVETNRVVLAPAPIHNDIAAKVSTTRETVARSFGILQRQKILRRIKGGIEILDVERLQELVEEGQEVV